MSQKQEIIERVYQQLTQPTPYCFICNKRRAVYALEVSPEHWICAVCQQDMEFKLLKPLYSDEN